MSLPNTPEGVIKARFHFEPGADTAVRPQTQFSYTGGPPTTADLSAAALTIRNAFAAHLASLVPSGDQMFDVECYDLANQATPFGTDITPVVGTRSGTLTPNNVTLLLNKQVNRRYRGSKPKNFWPWGVSADMATSTQWSGAFVAAVDVAWAAFIAAIDGAVAGAITLGPEVAVSYYAGKETNPNPASRYRFRPTQCAVPLVQDVVSNQASLVFGSQRRRLRP
jgi:hypothetical protein